MAVAAATVFGAVALVSIAARVLVVSGEDATRGWIASVVGTRFIVVTNPRGPADAVAAAARIEHGAGIPVVAGGCVVDVGASAAGTRIVGAGVVVVAVERRSGMARA
jgi:hypothetical protein